MPNLDWTGINHTPKMETETLTLPLVTQRDLQSTKTETFHVTTYHPQALVPPRSRWPGFVIRTPGALDYVCAIRRRLSQSDHSTHRTAGGRWRRRHGCATSTLRQRTSRANELAEQEVVLPYKLQFSNANETHGIELLLALKTLC